MTIKEIARQLNVSTATVSNVIHGHLEKMSPETAQMVRENLNLYQYIPNMGARMLAKGASTIIGVITNYPNREEKFALQDPFVSEIIGALENAIHARGYYTMLHAAQNINEILNIAQTWNADGLIVMGLQADQCSELIQATKKPVVFIDCYFKPGEQYNNIGLDDCRGMYLLTKYMISQGHRDMLFIGDQPTLMGVDDHRLQGHRQALAEEGIEWNDDRYYIISKDSKPRQNDFEVLLHRIGKEKDTAWMFISDYYAVDAMDFLLDNNISIPDDISITGFDDNILAHMIRPRLTTVHQNVTMKAEMAVKTIVEILDGTLDEPFYATLPAHLVRGKSVRNLKK